MADEIIPDDKNWTWVLERRCDECGFVAAAFDVSRVAQAIRDIGAGWVRVLSRADVRTRPQAGVWSPLEYGCHVRDVFRIMDRRLGLMLDSIDPRFENWDQDATAVEDDYAGQSPETVAREMTAAAEAFARRYESVTGDQWGRRGFRSDGAAFTVESLARYMVHDPLHHLWDVGEQLPAF
jgi:hypothetical protein